MEKWFAKEKSEGWIAWKNENFSLDFGALGAAGHFVLVYLCSNAKNIFTVFRFLVLVTFWHFFSSSSPDPLHYHETSQFSSLSRGIFIFEVHEKVEFRFAEHKTSISFNEIPSGTGESGRFLHHLAVHRHRILAKNLFAFNQTSSSTFPAAEKHGEGSNEERRERGEKININRNPINVERQMKLITKLCRTKEEKIIELRIRN